MGRFQLLEKEINKNVPIDEKSNIVINGWSPNNVRRLIIGWDYAIVQYFVTGGKYSKLREVVDFRKVLDKELQDINADPTKYKTILQVLTNGRICSSVEEIIFCKQGYPEHVLGLDYNLTKLASGNANLENRFVRLRHVSIVPTDIKTLSPFLDLAKESDTLLLDVLKEKNIPYRTLVDLNEDNWWKGVSLRPKFYSMDLQTLPNYFDKLKEKKELQAREDKLDEISSKQDSEAIAKYLPTTSTVLHYVFNLVDKGTEIFEKAPIISKAEWANVLQYQNMSRGIKKELIKNEAMITMSRRIDFDKIIKVATQNGVTEDDVRLISKFRDYVFNHILTDEVEYKRESNKSTVTESLQTLQKLVGTIFTHQVNIVYLAFIKYLTRNTPEYVTFYYGKLNPGVDGLLYTRTIIEYCNNNMETGWAKQAMDKINTKEVLVEEHKLPIKNSDVLKIIDNLLSLV